MKLIYRGSSTDSELPSSEINAAISHNLQYEKDWELGRNLINYRENFLDHSKVYFPIKWRMEHHRYHDRINMDYMMSNNVLALIHDLDHP